MKKQKSFTNLNKRSYVHEFHNAFYNTNETNLYDLLGKHAAYMIDMAIRDRENKRRDIMNSWVKIDRLNSKWINMLCPISSHDDCSFENITKKLVRGYSDILGDYIIDGIFDKKHIDVLIDSIATYYGTLSNTKSKNEREKIKGLLKQHTWNIKGMVDVLDDVGKNGNDFHTKARECIISANLLGSQLDYTIF